MRFERVKMKTMKFVYFATLLVLIACSSKAPVSQVQEPEVKKQTTVKPKLSSSNEEFPEEPADLIEYVGLVHENKLGCGVLIQVTMAQEMKMFSPKKLGKEFHQQDMLITFTFRESGEAKPTGCKSDGVIELVSVRGN
jgi:hypothetical protein